MTATPTTGPDGGIGPAPSAGEPPSSPYVGLRFYTVADAPLFFGRDAERQVIMGNLRASRLTLLYAQSGVGKSSLLRAGVAARLGELARQSLSGGGSISHVPVVFSSWKDDPTDELIDEIEASTTDFLGSNQRLVLPRESLHSAIEAAVAALGRATHGDSWDGTSFTLVVILDQFEEYFLYGARETRVGRFAEELADCLNRSDLHANFLISIREDAYSALGDLLKGRMSNVYGNYLHLEYLDSTAARDAIEKPIERYNAQHPRAEPITIESGLVETVLRQVRRARSGDQVEQNGGRSPPPTGRNAPGIVTPYLQLVMTALWERELNQGSHTLRLATLDELRGAEEIVSRHLENALDALGPSAHEVALDLLRYLVTPSGSKIALEAGDLAVYSGHPVERVTGVLAELAGTARVLREVPPAPGRPTADDSYRRFEIYHDVLAGPINEAVRAGTMRRLEREKEAADERARQERRRARIFRTLAIAATALLAVAVVAGVIAAVQSSRARKAQHVAVSRQLAGQAESELGSGSLVRGALLSLDAYSTSPTADARSSLVQALDVTSGMTGYLTGHTAPVTGVAYSPRGDLVAAASDDQRVIVWNTKTRRRVAVLPSAGSLTSLAFAPDGRTVAAGDANGRVSVWNATSGRRVALLSSPYGAAASVAFSPDGRRVAMGSGHGPVTLSDSASGELLRTLDVGLGEVDSVAFSPNGQTLAVASARGAVTLWSARSGRMLRTLRQHTGPVYSVAFNAAGDTLASAGSDRTIVMSTVTGHVLHVLSGHSSAVESVAFSPDGTLLASGGDDRTVRLWDSHSGRRVAVLRGHEERVTSVAFSPTRDALASGSWDNSVILWDVRPFEGSRPTLEQQGGVAEVAFSPNGNRLASASGDGPVRLWDSASGQLLRSFSARTTGAKSVAFSRNGRLVASGVGNSVLISDAASGQVVRGLHGHDAVVWAVAFSPAAQTLASAAADHKVILWNPLAGKRVRVLPVHSGPVNDLAFSPDGRLLASASYDGSVVVSNVADGRTRLVLKPDAGPLSAVAFSRDGKMLASGGSPDGGVILWDARTGRRLGDPLAGQQGTLTSVAFSPDGKLLASASEDASVVVWNLKTRLGQPVAQHWAPVNTLAFDPQGRMIATGGDDQTVMLSALPRSAGDRDVIYRSLCRFVGTNLKQPANETYRKECPQW